MKQREEFDSPGCSENSFFPIPWLFEVSIDGLVSESIFFLKKEDGCMPVLFYFNGTI